MNNKEKLLEIFKILSKDNIVEFIKSLDESKIELLFNDLNKTNSESKKDSSEDMSDFMFNMLKKTTAKITGEKQITYHNSNNEWVLQQDYKNGYLYAIYYTKN